MGIQERGQAALNRVMQAQCPVAVTYSRAANGVTRSVALTAWLGNTTFAGLTESDVQVVRGERDYLVLAADLKLGGVATTPLRGDRVTETASGLVFEVASPDAGEPAWRYSDHERTRFRVHCRRVNP